MNHARHAMKKPTLLLYLAIGVFALGLIILLFAAGLQGTPQNRSQPQPATITTSQIHIQHGFNTPVSLYGLIESAQASKLAFDTTGQVVTISVDEGDKVEAGQVVATLDSQRLTAKRAELTAALARAKANLSLAELSGSRVADLVAQKLESSQRLDEAKANTEVAKAQVSEIEAALNSLAVELGKTTLRAPYNGIVSQRFVDEGEVLTTGMSVLSITNQQAFQVRIAVPADMLASFPPGENVRVMLGEDSVSSRVIQHLPVRDRQTRTIDILVSLPAQTKVRAGDMASITGTKHHAEIGSWLPVTALSNGLRGLWRVLVVDTKAHTLQARSVEVLYTDGERAFVRGALADGEHYVTNGTHKLAPGQRVSMPASPLAGAAR